MRYFWNKKLEECVCTHEEGRKKKKGNREKILFYFKYALQKEKKLSLVKQLHKMLKKEKNVSKHKIVLCVWSIYILLSLSSLLSSSHTRHGFKMVCLYAYLGSTLQNL